MKILLETICFFGGLVAVSGTAMAASVADLSGAYGVVGTGTCIVSPSGFNANGQPNDPEKSLLNSLTYKGVTTYDGAGKYTAVLTVVGILTGRSPNSVPTAGTSEVHGEGTYEIGAQGEVMSKATATAKALTGPRTGQTFEIRGIEFSGHISADGKTLVGGTGMGISTTSFTPQGGNTVTTERICSEADIEVKLGP